MLRGPRFRRLFPRSRVLKDAHCSDCDLVVTAKAGSEALTGSGNQLRGVRVTIILTAVDSSGTTLGSLVVARDGHQTRSIYWSSFTQARAITTPALALTAVAFVAMTTWDERSLDGALSYVVLLVAGAFVLSRHLPRQTEIGPEIDPEASTPDSGQADHS